jgi:hypothetical protein
MVEAINRRDQFDNFSDNDFDIKLAKLTQVIKKYAAIRVSISIDKAAFFNFSKSIKLPIRNHNTDKPYCMAFHRILLEMPKIQLLHAYYFGSSPRPIDFIFDEQGEIGIEAQSTWLMIKRLAERLAQQGRSDFRPCLGSMPSFKNEKEFPPLQAADLYAWSVRRFLYENRILIIPPNSYLKSLSEIPPIHTHVGGAELNDLRYGTSAARAQFSRENPNIDLLPYQGSKAQQKRNRAKRRAEARAFQV